MHEYGTVGASLKSGFTTADRARQGALGEQACAALIRKAFARCDDVAVLHDLTLPGGSQANVDHIIVRGNRILLIDAKRWKAGIYVTAAGRTIRVTSRGGLSRFPAGDKGTVPMAVRIVREQLGHRVARTPSLTNARVAGAILVQPTGTGLTSLSLYRPAGDAHAHVIRPAAVLWLRRLLPPGPPDPAVLRMLHTWTSDTAAVSTV
jgi:hypothetical protein